MKRAINIILIFSFSFLLSMKKEKLAYLIYTKNGEKVTYGEMVDGLKDADVIFFGELHGNPIAHWLQLELTMDMYKTKKGKMVLGSEMFESENQIVIDEFLQGLISKSKLISNVRLEGMGFINYQPIVLYAKKKKIPFIATNVPRRYASIVFARGFMGLDQLSDRAKNYMAPLPIEFDPNLESYKNIEKHIGGSKRSSGHPTGNTARAQALKDATMAYFINKNFQKGKVFIHFNGNYHSDNYEGIIWYLKKLNNDLKIMNISTSSKEKIENFDKNQLNKADYIITVPGTMTGIN